MENITLEEALKQTEAVFDLEDEIDDADETIEPETEEKNLLAGIADEKVIAAYSSMKKILDSITKLGDAVDAFEALIPRPEPKPEYTFNQFKNDFFKTPLRGDSIYKMSEGVNPPSIALVTLMEFLADEQRFQRFDFKKLPGFEKLNPMFQAVSTEEPNFTSVNIGNKTFVVPVGQYMWIHDSKLNFNCILKYSIEMGGIFVKIEGSYDHRSLIHQLFKEIQELILNSPHFRGQVLELFSGGFQIVNLKDIKEPALDPVLKSEIEKNVLNVFKKKDQFSHYKIPAKRSVLLEGLPGNGKTLAAKYIAKSLLGEVTTLWVTAKAINSPNDVQMVFEYARKFSPSFVVMEDLDLIAGSREDESGCFGEMLSQMDGLQSNDCVVLFASTNKVKSLDFALTDRPGRFDRIWQIGKPNPEIAEQIAKYYLEERNIDSATIDGLSYTSVTKGDLTGAQIVEVCKGALVEAIHRNCPINDFCMTASYKGLMDQKRLILDEAND